MRVLLLSTYEMGRQPFGLASPAAWLREAGHVVRVLDLSRDRLDAEAVREADLIACHVPMHTATRLLAPVLARARALNPAAHLCVYGLYAPLTAAHLRASGAQTILGPEFEADLVSLADRLAAPPSAGTAPSESPQALRSSQPSQSPRGADAPPTPPSADNGLAGQAFSPERPASPPPVPLSPPLSRALPLSLPPLPRLAFRVPDRRGLPPLERYARLQVDGESRLTGYTEATRGCKHVCRHCPIVPVYGGRFRAVPADVVLADVAQQVAAGARHITFGDPDFFNGPTHAETIVTRLARQHPGLTYDVTIKVEHLLAHRRLLPALHDTGCLFITSAVESTDDDVLQRLAKGHTRADFIEAAALCRAHHLHLTPTFVAFTPWTTMEMYWDLLQTVRALGLVANVPSVQWTIRLLIPDGSRLLELDDVRALVEPFDRTHLVYPWTHADPRVDDLQQRVARLAGRAQEAAPARDRVELFEAIEQLARERLARPDLDGGLPPPLVRAAVPYLDEPWYC